MLLTVEFVFIGNRALAFSNIGRGNFICSRYSVY